MQVYADNAATTKMSQVALDAMIPALGLLYGNPSSLHSVGQTAKEELDKARATVAQCLGCEPREIYFTPAAVRPTIRPFVLLPTRVQEKAKSTSFPPLLSITLCFTP